MAGPRRSNKFTPTKIGVTGSSNYISQSMLDRLENALRLQQAAFIQNEKKRLNIGRAEAVRAARLGSFNVAKAVGEAILHEQIFTSREFQQIAARAQAQLNALVVEAFDDVYDKVQKNASRDLVYAKAVQLLGVRDFKLYVSDASIIQPLENEARLIARLSQLMREGAQSLIYAALEDTLNEAFGRLSEAQFPHEYRALMMAILLRNQEENSLKIIGQTLKTWQIIVDFDKIFGDREDFEQGFHYGALLANQDGSRIKNRARLPYHNGMKLKNGLNVRYGYWKAMWAGKSRFYGGYSGPAGSRKGQIARIERKQKLEADRMSEIYTIAAEEGRLRRSGKGYSAKLSIDERVELQDRANRRERLESSKADVKPRSIKIPEGQRQQTIDARVGYWLTKGVAPFWEQLEFGQLKFDPRIPPLAITYRFYAKATRAIEKYALQVWNKQIAPQTGYGFNDKGQRFYAGPTGYAINFFANVPKNTKTGAILKDTVKPISIYGTARRNAEDAIGVAGRFAPQEVIPYITKQEKRRGTIQEKLNTTVNDAFRIEPTPVDDRPTGAGQYPRSNFTPKIDIPKVDRRTKQFRDAKKRIANAGPPETPEPKKKTPRKTTAKKPSSNIVSGIDMTNYKPSNKGRKPKG